MVRWRSAEQLLAENSDDEGPAFGGSLFALNISRIILRPASSHGSAAFAAVYRCQAPDPDCQCFDCVTERSSHPKKGRSRERPKRRQPFT